MAQGYAAELVGVLDSTLTVPSMADGRVVGGRLRVHQATLDLSLAAVKKANGDTNVLFKLPAGSKPLYFITNASATMGAAATIAVGTAASAAKYRAAAVHTAVDTPAMFMKSSAADDDPLSAEETVIMTIGTADLPGAGIFQCWAVCAAR